MRVHDYRFADLLDRVIAFGRAQPLERLIDRPDRLQRRELRPLVQFIGERNPVDLEAAVLVALEHLGQFHRADVAGIQEAVRYQEQCRAR